MPASVVERFIIFFDVECGVNILRVFFLSSRQSNSSLGDSTGVNILAHSLKTLRKIST